jgi:acetyl-CoA acetyltransferase
LKLLKSGNWKIMELQNVVLVDGARSAFARGGRGKLVATRLDDAGAQVLRALLDRNPKVKDNMIEDVGLGNVSGRGEFVMLGAVPRLAGLPLELAVIASAGPAWRPCTGL